MKFLISLFCSFYCISLVGQTPSELSYRLDLYQAWKDSDRKSAFKIDSTGFSQLPKKESPNVKGIYTFDPQYSHLVDLNKDGIKDLIYAPAYPPYSSIKIFLSKSNHLENIYSYPGKLVALNTFDDKSVIHIIKPSCCCDYYNDLIQISIDSNSNIQRNNIEFHYDTDIEKEFEFKEIYYSGILRTSPIENDSLGKDPCTDDPIIGNHLKKIENQKLFVLKEVGFWKQVWYLENEGYSQIGWIK